MSRFPGAADLGVIFIKSETVCPMSLIESLRPFDLSKTLQQLTQAGLLESTGGRGAIYHLPGEPIPTPDDVFGPATRFSVPSSPNLAASSPNLAASSPNLAETRDPDGCLISEQLSLPVVDDLESLS